MLFKRTVVLFCVLAFFGCGKNLPKLTSDQKSALKGTLNNASDALGAAPQGGSASNSLRSFLAIEPNDSTDAGLSGRAGGSASEPSGSSTKAQMAQRLQKGLSDGSCTNETASQMTPSRPSFGSSPGAGAGAGMAPGMNFALPKIKISGAKCPVLMEMSGEAKDKAFAFRMKYKVQDADYLKLNEIDEMSFELATAQTTAKSATGSFTGKFHGQKSGNITISGSFTGSEKGMEGAIRFEFPDFAAEFGVKMEAGEVTYTLNGEKQTEAEIKEYFGKALPVSGKPAHGGQDQPKLPEGPQNPGNPMPDFPS